MAELKYNGSTVNSVVSQITNIAGKFDPVANSVKTSTGVMVGRRGFDLINPGISADSISQSVGTCSEALGALVKEIRDKQVAILTYSQDKDEINAFVNSLSRLEYDNLDLSGIDSKISGWTKLSFAAKGLFASAGTFLTGFVEGAANFVETAVDTAAVVATGAASIFTKPYDLITGSNVTDEMWESTKAYVAKEQVASIADEFYANTEAGQWLKQNAYGFDTVRGIGKGVGYSTTMILAGNVFAGAGGVDAAVKGARLAKALPAMSGILGFGNGAEEGWGNGASTEKGLVYGAAAGTWESIQWGVGVKIGSLGSHIDDIAKVGAKQVFKDASKRVILDTVDSGLEGFVQPALTMIYREYDGNTLAAQYANAFEANGGWNGVIQQAVIGGLMSGASEAGDVFKYNRNAAKIKKSGGSTGADANPSSSGSSSSSGGDVKAETVLKGDGHTEAEARVKVQETSADVVAKDGGTADANPKKPVDTTPSNLVDVTPSRAVDTTPSKPVDVTPSRAVDTIPIKPVDITPNKPVDVTPSKPVDVTPSRAVDTTPSKPVDVTPSRAVDTTPIKPVDITPNKPVDVTPSKPVDVTPSKPVDVIPSKPANIAPSKPVDTTPSNPANITPSKPTNTGAGAKIETLSSQSTGLAGGLSSFVGDTSGGKISGVDVSKAGVGVVSIAGLGKLGTSMSAAKSMGADLDVDVKFTGDTGATHTRTSRQLSGDLEKMAAALPGKQAKIDAADANLAKYRAEAGSTADPKVIKKLEGDVSKAHADYDKQLSRVKDKAEQRNSVAAQEIDEKLASGSKKGLVGTEKGKLVDGEFTKETAKAAGEIDRKEFGKLLDKEYGKVDRTKVDEFGNPLEVKTDADGTPSPTKIGDDTSTAERVDVKQDMSVVEAKQDVPTTDVRKDLGITDNETYDSLATKVDQAVADGKLTREQGDSLFDTIAEEQHFDAKEQIADLRRENEQYAQDRQANIDRKELLVAQDGAKPESVNGYDEAVRQIDERINSNNEEISRINQETGAVGSDSSTKVEGESNLDVIDTESLDAKFDRLSDEITSDIKRTYGENAEVVSTGTEIKPEDSKVVTTTTQESEVKDVPLSPAQQRAKEAELALEAEKKGTETTSSNYKKMSEALDRARQSSNGEVVIDGKTLKTSEITPDTMTVKREAVSRVEQDFASVRKKADEGVIKAEKKGTETTSSNYKKMSEALDRARQSSNGEVVIDGKTYKAADVEAQIAALKNGENSPVVTPSREYAMKKADEGSVRAEKKGTETTSSNYNKMSEALDRARQSSNGEVVIDGKTFKTSEITPDTMTVKREAASRVEQDLASVRKKADEGVIKAEKKGTETTSSNYKKMSEALDRARQSSNGEVVIDGKTFKTSEITPDTMTVKREAASRVEQDLASVRKKADEGVIKAEKKGTETTSSNYKKMSEALDRARQSSNGEVVIDGKTYKAADVEAQMKKANDGGTKYKTPEKMADVTPGISDSSYNYSKVDSNGNLIEQRWTEASGAVVHDKFNSDGSIVRQKVEADGTKKNILYGKDNKVVRHTEVKPNGTQIDTFYDTNGSIINQRLYSSDGTSTVYTKTENGSLTTYYDKAGNTKQTVENHNLGTKITTDYGSDGNYVKTHVNSEGKIVERISYSNGVTTAETFNAAGRTVNIDGNGVHTHTRYDVNNRIIEKSVRTSDGTVHATTYKPDGVVMERIYHPDDTITAKRTNPDGSTRVTKFNKNKQQVERIDTSANKVVTTTKYNEDGSTLVKVNNPKGYKTEILYGSDNKPIRSHEVNPDGTFVNKKFDRTGNLIETVSTSKSGTVTVETRQSDGSVTTKVTTKDNSVSETVIKDKFGKVTREVMEYDNGTKYDKVINPDGSSSVKILNPDKTYDIRKLDSNGKLLERQWTTKDGTIRTQTPLPDGSTKRHTVDANGNVRDSIFNKNNILVEQVETRPDGSTKLYKVNSDGSRTITEISKDGTRNITTRNIDDTFEVKVLDSKGRIIGEKWSDRDGRIITERPNADGTFSRNVVEADKRVIDLVTDKFGNVIRQTETRPDGTQITYVKNSDGSYDRKTVNKNNKLLAREYRDSSGTLRVEKANGDGTYSRHTSKSDGTISDTVFGRNGEVLHRIENRPDKSKIITERTVDGGKVVTEISKNGVSTRHVYDKFGNEVRPQSNVRQHPQENGQSQSAFDRFRRQQPQVQPQQMPTFRNAQEVVSAISNPLSETNLQKIVSRLNDGQYISAYEKIVTLNTATPKTPPSLKAVGEFQSKFGIDRSNYCDTYYNSKGTRIYHQGEYFDHITSRGFDTYDITDRLYLNIADYSQSYKFCELFADECERRGIPYYFKTASAVDGNRLQPMQLNRDESIVIYSGKQYLSEYTNIASDIVSKYGFKLEEPPILTGKLKNNIGYGAEPNIPKESFNSIRSKIIESSVRYLNANYRSRGLSINSSSYIRDLMKLIVERGNQCGIDMNNFCLNIK